MPDDSPTRIVGWLLRANRLLGPDEKLRAGKEFARVFRRDGEKSLAASQITRWESGQIVAGHTTLRRYEYLLGVSDELLVTLNEAMFRLAGGSTVRQFQSRSVTAFHELLERAQTPGEMDGRSWSHLTELIATQPSLVLHPPALWSRIAHRLLDELVVSASGEWLQRQEAMSRLLEHPDAGPHAVAACITLAGSASSPVVIEPLSLLGVANRADSNAYLIEQIGQSGEARVVEGALLGTLRKISGGHFREGQWARLVREITARLRDPWADRSLLPLVAEAGRLLARRHPDATALIQALRKAGAQAEPVELPQGRMVSARIATTALGLLGADTLNADDVLVTLIQDALYSPDPDRRLMTGMLIAATPYREPVAQAVLQELARDLARRGDYPLTSLRLLTNLDVDIHRPLAHTILTKPGFGAGLRHHAAWAMPHCSGRDTEDTWRQTLSAATEAWLNDPSGANCAILHGITYGIGTDGHSGLLARIRIDERLPSSARSTASWLEQMSPKPR